tara:strand:+ start:6076 stop:7497 length:1422 start_codon:yes stop_codon:yes gene_type:complete
MPSKKQKARIAKKQVTNARRSDLNRGSLRGPTRFGNSNIGYELVGGYHGADRKRQIWDQAGYPQLVLPEMLWNESRRNGYAKGIIDIKAGESWQDDPIIYDGDEDPKRRKESPTEFEIAIDKWADEWELWERIEGADRRQMVMRYSGLIIFAREPEKSTPEKPMQTLAGPEAITKIMPVFETQIEVNEAIQDQNSVDYGQPKHFQFRSEVVGSRNTWMEQDFVLHPSRVVTFAEGADDGSIYGIPEFESYFNPLLDLEKIRMSGGEGSYKNSSQKIAINLDPKLTQGLSAKQQDAFDDNIDDFNQDMNRALVLAGAEAKSLQATMSDTSSYSKLAENEVAAGSGLPWTIIVGQQTGRLASDEDQTQKNVVIERRQKKWVTPMVKKMLKKLIEINALPKPESKITVCWPDITEPSFSDKVATGKDMMTTNELSVKAQQDPVYSTEYIQEYVGIEVEKIEREPTEGAEAPTKLIE